MATAPASASPTAASAAQINDEYVGRQERMLTLQELRPYTQVSEVRAVLHMAFDWALIVGVAMLCERFWNPLLYALTVIVIGGRQHALGVIAHDAAHYTLFKNRRANDLIAEVLLAWPILVSLRFYRRQHLAHHANLNSEHDPDFIRNRPDLLPEQRSWLAVVLLMAGKGTKQGGLASMFLGKASKPGDRAWIVARFVTYAAVAAAITWFGWWRELALYWVVPLFTWFVFVMRVRGLVEHWGVPNRTPLDMTRTVLVSSFERLFFLPHNINLHIEHHHYPRVPFYRLPALHRHLWNVPVFREQARVSRGIVRAVREIFRYPAQQRAESA